MNNRHHHHDDDARFLALLWRWVSGNFNRQDEETLNALIATDTFRREAWQGLNALPEEDHEAALQRLQQQISPVSKQRRPLLSRWWMPVASAAALLLLIGALYWWWADTPHNKAPQADLSAQMAPASPPDAMAEAATSEANDSQPLATSDRPTVTPRARESVSPVTEGVREAPLSAISSAKHDSADTLLRSAYSRPEAAEPASAPMRSEERPLAVGPPGRVFRRDRTDAAEPSPALEKMSLQTQQARPREGWEAFMVQYRAGASLERAEERDSLRVELRIGPDGTPQLLRIQPPLPLGQQRQLDSLLQRFRWEPAGTQATLSLPWR